jgi:SAM-dependent methyltransferase
MVASLLENPRLDTLSARDLRRRLDEFYASCDDYDAFECPTDHSAYFDRLRPGIGRALARRGNARVLELGAGRSSFGDHFAAERARGEIAYHAQDVTARNREYLAARAERVLVTDVSALQGDYDVIFSTFVLEHVANPTEFLEQVDRLLGPTGMHAVFCPNYELPGYLCPSLRHLRGLRRYAAMGFLVGSRLRAAIDGRPRFWVNSDPAVFHGPWYRDADAVHIVSRRDVIRWHRARGYTVSSLYDPWPSSWTGLKDYALWRGICTMLAFTKR